jgi:hypothetical protein
MSDAKRRAELQEHAFDHAWVLYSSIADTLADVIEVFKKKAQNQESLENEDFELLKQHQKALLLVIGFETDIAKRHASAHRDGPVFDLAAARAEVARRIARLEHSAES